MEQAIVYYERAADLFQSEEVTTSANQCKQKIAQFAAQLEQLSLPVPLHNATRPDFLLNMIILK